MSGPRTLRGAGPVKPVDPSSTAVLLIDYQREYVDGGLPLPGAAQATGGAVRLLRLAERCGMAVIHVHHHGAPGARFFDPGGPGAQPVPELAPAAGYGRLVKSMPSAFHATGLGAELERRRIRNLVVAGFMTHMCVDTTVRDAVHRGYRCLVAEDACATRDLPGRAGDVIPHGTVHGATLAALGDRFADIVAVDELETLVR